jgi:hypothetical protein
MTKDDLIQALNATGVAHDTPVIVATSDAEFEDLDVQLADDDTIVIEAR